MIWLVIYFLAARMQDVYADRSQAWQWALGMVILHITQSYYAPFWVVFITSALIFLYTWGHFTLLRRFSENLMLYFAVLISGALLPFVLTMTFMASSTP